MMGHEARWCYTVRGCWFDHVTHWRKARLKKLINSPQNEVRDGLAGLASAHADLLQVRRDPDFVVRRDAPVMGKVGILSGGGSGHEPLHSGYVGRGMLDAACPGPIFTSPVPDQIIAATKAIDGGAGVLYIVKNYTGDVMNFEMAAEMVGAEGITTATVLIDDDVAVQDSSWTAGRRGVGTTVLAEKIVGAAAEEGRPLLELQRLGAQIRATGRSMGVALTSCTVATAGHPTFDLPPDQIEIGIGIHGEPGRRRIGSQTASDLVAMLAHEIVADLPFQRGDRVLALVNGMGATPLGELYIMYHELEHYLAVQGIAIARRLVGNYITALDMAGCSLTLLKLDDELIRLWDAPVHTPALRWGI
jgi:phosphoenolpyruvate---glycerone phosphotransferase subunit DhaK